MDHTEPDTVRRAIRIWPCSLVLLHATLMAASAQPVRAEGWVVAPELSVAEIYTDNVTLAAEGAEEDDFVTEISPGIRVYREGRRVDVNINYRIQNLLYAEDSDRNATLHQLLADADAELVAEHLYLQTQASVSQRVESPEQGITFDNVNPTGNRIDQYVLAVSPEYRHNFAGLAQVQVRYTYSGVRYEDGPAESDSDAVDASFSSGPRFTRLSWMIAYRNNDVERDDADDVKYEQASAEAAYRVTNTLSALVRGGYENNDIPTAFSRRVKDGSYWAGGLSWMPNARTELDAVYGDRFKSASMTWGPSTRSNFTFSWRDRDVGVNPGELWSGRARWRSRRASLQASYLEDTTTVQQQIAIPRFFNLETGETVTNPAPGDPVVVLPEPILELTDEVFERSRGEISFGWKSGKSNIILGLYRERREFLESLDDETALGTSALWDWRLVPRTHLVLDARWQQSEFRGRDDEDEDWYAQLALNRQIWRQADASLAYSHASRDSATAGREYQENRVTLRMNIHF